LVVVNVKELNVVRNIVSVSVLENYVGSFVLAKIVLITTIYNDSFFFITFIINLLLCRYVFLVAILWIFY
jgi:hypothetical protein